MPREMTVKIKQGQYIDTNTMILLETNIDENMNYCVDILDIKSNVKASFKFDKFGNRINIYYGSPQNFQTVPKQSQVDPQTIQRDPSGFSRSPPTEEETNEYYRRLNMIKNKKDHR